MISGSSLRRPPPRSRSIAVLLLLSALSAPVAASPARPQIVIGATTLDVALIDLSRQTGVDIVSTEDGLRAVRTAAISGNLPVRVALARLLAGSDYRVVAIGVSSYRIVRRHRPRNRTRATAVPIAEAGSDIVVTASKQRIPLVRFPGTITSLFDGGVAYGAARGLDLDGVAAANPILQTTALGAGRNKVFIRGIADSSFNGATQSTASFYFGDVQLSYSGPEPALALIDIKQVEVMEGPQGTLYGAGAIGGVVRITPNPVDLDDIGGAVAGGVSATQRGPPGHDISGYLNVPVVTGQAGLRIVGYQEHDGGYVDDRGTRRTDVNGVDRVGGRAALRVEPAPGWTVDASILGQRIVAADAQYGEVALPALTRRSRLAQPYSNDIMLARGVIEKRWDNGLELLSATGVAHYTSVDTFDSSRAAPAPLSQYRNGQSNLLLTHETRLSRSRAGGRSWIVGIALLRDRNTQDRTLGPPGNPTEIIGVTNVSTSISLFGEATEPLTGKLSATLGLRGTQARVDGSPSVTPRAGDVVRGRQTSRVDPTIALSYLLTPRLSAYGRYQSGFRTGGLAVARGVGRVAEFTADSIGMSEVGLRLVRDRRTGIALSVAAAYAAWHAIQADLVDRRGLPYTANIGDAHIATLEATLDWVPVTGVQIDGSALFAHNKVSGVIANTSPANNRRLPDTPSLAAHGGARYSWDLGDGKARVGATIAYVGRSVLGIGDYLDVSQGRYATAGLIAGWTRKGLDLSLTLDNVTDTHANRFALGNPFSLAARDQTTPLRPRTMRLGVGFAF